MDTIESTALARTGGASPLPVFSGKQMTEALTAYRDLQHALDAAMPDQIMDLDGKKFRKKGYWRAVAVAFNISVETLEEHREVAGNFQDGRPNFGYVITRRAQAPNGRSVVADGTCFAVEKARRFKCPHPHASWAGKSLHFPHSSCPDFDPEFQWRTLPGDATEHNVRGHASTRAFNRAVSDLVGFGEVSAEEVERGEEHHERQEPAKAITNLKTVVNLVVDGQVVAQAAQPAGEVSLGATTVKSVGVKTGTNKRGAWTRYDVAFGDGRRGGTFSDTVGAQAQAAQASGVLVYPELEKTEKGSDLKGWLPQPKAADAAPAPDEPVDGPEKVLTVRKVVTDNGDRWIIQTAKRVLVTDQEAHATAALAAREGKLGVVPSFDVIAGTSGPVNKLKGLVVEVADAPAAREPRED